MASILRKLFKRKKQPPLVCAVDLDLDHDHNHQHTAACFVDFEPLAIAELFQSQGCQSCPPAIPGILEGTNRPNLLLLSYNVTLFDHLGWKDTYANTQWDARQRAYVRKWNRTSLFTPMVVVNGVVDGPGAGGPQEITDLLTRARAAASPEQRGFHLYVDANDTDVRIDSDKPLAMEGEGEGMSMSMGMGMGSAADVYDVLVAVYDPNSDKVKIGKGPNKGKKVEHRNIVQQIMKIGEWRGGSSVVIPLPMARSAMPAGQEAVVFVQAPGGGPVLGAAKI